MKLAIVHDYLNQYGGAERVLESFHEIFPDAPIYTSFYIPESTFPSFKNGDIRTSFMQRLPGINRHFKKYLLFYPRAFEQFDLRAYDVILSSSSAFAKGVRIPSGTCHICYCYNPMRFVWRYDDYIKREKINPLFMSLLPLLIKRLKRWDVKVNKRVHFFIAISNNIAERIKIFYNRESIVIYPPIDVESFELLKEDAGFYLIVSRLRQYKRIDIAVKAFNKLGYKLKIIGEGSDRKNLEKMAMNNIEFLGRQNDEMLKEYYGKCRALVFPGEEDFGITPLEAQACGKPVIAYGRGGALETIIDGITGVFFKEQTVESLIEAIKRFEKIKDSFNSERIRENALRFDKEIFKRKIKAFIEEKYSEFKKEGKI